MKLIKPWLWVAGVVDMVADVQPITLDTRETFLSLSSSLHGNGDSTCTPGPAC